MSFFFCLKLYFLNIIFTLSLSLFMFVHFSRIRTQIIDVKRLTTRQTTTRLPLLMFVTVPICLVFLSRLSMSTSIFSFLPSIYINLSNVLFLNRSIALASVDVAAKYLKVFDSKVTILQLSKIRPTIITKDLCYSLLALT